MTNAGDRLGPFLMIERIGRGGMGEVWLAQPVAIPGVHELCVVKAVRAEVADDADSLRRFADESLLAMLLHHPHISRVVDAGLAMETRYLALGLVEGVDLVTLMTRLAEKGGGLDESAAVWIMACALDALAFAHGAKHPLSGRPLGVVHRDISPQNIMCARSGNAHLIDFGLALSSVKQARTEQDVVIGKLAYMAPEQARGDLVDTRTDIYSLGVVFYELIAGSRYWGDLDDQQIWQLAGLETWTPPGFADLPPDIAAVLGPMIARAPEERAHLAAERLEALAPLLIARGGPSAASEALAKIVVDNAAPELERVARARALNLPHDAPTEGIFDPRAQSLAIAEAEAVAAALTSTISALLARAHVTNLASDAPTEGLVELGLPRLAFAEAGPAVGSADVDTKLLVVEDGVAAQTARLAAAAAPRRRPLWAIAAGVLTLATAVGLALGVARAQPRAAQPRAAQPKAAVVVAGGDVSRHPVDAGSLVEPPASVAAVKVGIASPTASVAADAGVPARSRPARRTLDDRLNALKGCDRPCANALRRGQANGRLDATTGAGRVATEGRLRTCELSCRKPR